MRSGSSDRAIEFKFGRRIVPRGQPPTGTKPPRFALTAGVALRYGVWYLKLTLNSNTLQVTNEFDNVRMPLNVLHYPLVSIMTTSEITYSCIIIIIIMIQT